MNICSGVTGVRETVLRGHFTFAPGFPDNPARPYVNKKTAIDEFSVILSFC